MKHFSTIEDKVAAAGKAFKQYVLKIYKTPWHTLSDTTLREALKEFNKEKRGHLGTKVFTAEQLREHWSKGTKVSYKGVLYRVGRMSYGDYFLEPGPERGEREPFSKGTLWLERVDKGTYIIANPKRETKKKGKHLSDTIKKGEHLKGNCVKHVDIQKYVIQGVKHYRARVQGKDWRFETKPGETLDMFRARIMDTLDCGIVTHFIEDWEPGKHLR